MTPDMETIEVLKKKQQDLSDLATAAWDAYQAALWECEMTGIGWDKLEPIWHRYSAIEEQAREAFVEHYRACREQADRDDP